MDRLERIERLRTGGGSRLVLLGEVRQLLAEGERWVAAEPVGTDRAADLLDECRRRVDPSGEEAVMRA